MRRRGSVVVVVLVLVALGSMLMLRLIEDNALELALAARDADRNRLRNEAWSEMELALATMAEISRVDSNRLHVPAQGWGDPHAYAGIGVRPGLTITYTFEEESAKLPLASMTQLELTNLLEALGLSLRDAQSVSDAILAWTKPGYEPQDALASELAYERAALAYRPPGRPLRSFDELRSVGVAHAFFFGEDGRPTRLLEDFRRCVSLCAFEGTNVNTCDPLVLKAKGYDDRTIEEIIAYRTDPSRRPSGSAPYFTSMTEFKGVTGNPALANGLSTLCRLVRVRVRLQEGRASHEVSALVATNGTASFPEAMADPDSGAAGNVGDKPVGANSLPSRTPSAAASAKDKTAATTSGRQTAGTQRLTTGRATLGGDTAASGGGIQYPFKILAWGESTGRRAETSEDSVLNRFAIEALSDHSPLKPETLTDPPNPHPAAGSNR